MPLHDEDVVVEAAFAGDFNDLYKLSSLWCRSCGANWLQYRIAGHSLKHLRCVRCNDRKVSYYEGEPSTEFIALH